jgi:pantothenate kinase type III
MQCSNNRKLDVGNTNITIGVFKRKEIIEVFRITTKLPRTSDEFGILISSLLKEKGLDEGEVKAMAASFSRVVTGESMLSFSTQLFSQRAGQMRPVNSGKSLVSFNIL